MQEKSSTYTKTIWQHSKPLPSDTMECLKGIAEDYAKVKRAVYDQFSGIRKMNRLTPVFTVMTAMRHSGLREQLNLPVVYYELAVIDAVSDIKGMWSLLKNKIREKVTESDYFSDADRMYLRTVLRIDSTLSDVLNGRSTAIPDKCKDLEIDADRLNKWLCSRVRKYRRTPQVSRRDYFKVSPNGYRYGEDGLYIVSRQPRKRIRIPLKDDQVFDRQIVINTRDNTVNLAIPVDSRIIKHEDYVNMIYLHIGYRDMFTLSNGNIYGSDLGSLITQETERLDASNQKRRYYLFRAKKDQTKSAVIIRNNTGIRKYNAKKLRARRQMETFINTEIRRLICTEKPGRIITTKQVIKGRTVFKNPKSNRIASRRFENYIRKRLGFKCLQNSIELIEINSSGTGSICSNCGAEGIRAITGFECPSCGYKASFAENGARNIEKKYLEIYSGTLKDKTDIYG